MTVHSSGVSCHAAEQSGQVGVVDYLWHTFYFFFTLSNMLTWGHHSVASVEGCTITVYYAFT